MNMRERENRGEDNEWDLQTKLPSKYISVFFFFFSSSFFFCSRSSSEGASGRKTRNHAALCSVDSMRKKEYSVRNG